MQSIYNIFNEKKGKKMNLYIKTKHFITIRLKNPMKTQLLYKYKCFFFDIYIFFPYQ